MTRTQGDSPRTIPTRPVAILNPVARGCDRVVDNITRRAALAGWPVPVIIETSPHDSGGGQAAQALELGADLVIVGGGDGTVRAVAERLRGTGVQLGIIPLGTANIFARNLGLSPRRLDRAVQISMFGSASAVDLGVATFTMASLPGQGSREHLFLVLAGLGNDADTVSSTRPGLKRRLGWLAYFESGARHMVRRPIRMTVTIDDQPPHARALWSFLVGNAGRIPLGIEVFPEARLDDGKLRTMEARISHLWQWAPVALAGLRRTARTPVLVHGVARRVRLRPESPTALQLDGDTFGPVIDVDIHVDPGALLVRQPHTRTKGGRP
ncbi:diacylglycerol kinase family protein [Luteococcus sp. H138]|uniref:diacylglycerol/lipid kinase family protein n=1 Tax=unclassified Luteococcus TaxID=2639923 RepID=UPI00313D57F9